jgi:hypothetical protein
LHEPPVFPPISPAVQFAEIDHDPKPETPDNVSRDASLLVALEPDPGKVVLSRSSSEQVGKIIEQTSAPREKPKPGNEKAGSTWWRRPFEWTNVLFDAAASRSGAPGRWMMGQVGRGFLAATGALLLAAAAGWIALERMGWTW